ncbi:hypothetical protein MWU65_12120 [Cellulophaga sp. F20128]|uniref:c-type cytochrome domain-containing protein n=1 Tax=Cellulophaga sp. F20128 TaxID=2926413 RepID=UPI001FF62D7F|nr:c-type cytochrome domain-containing protein [Cellulophaga sp. F20128]MCK0157933.1 hypothetical protein [Cellulophaga sp. F20128]
MEVITQLLGRLHPLLVHLPIGFIIFGLLFLFLDRKQKDYTKPISFAFLWGGIIGVFTCISGYLLYLNEGYAFDTIKFHLWIGITTTVFSFLVYLKLQDKFTIAFFKRVPTMVFSILMFALISATGHLGGNITHGEDFLTEPLPNGLKAALGIATNEKKEIVLDEENWQDTKLYADVVQPILNNKCVSCHGSKKAKGELRLHTPEAILAGGENGEIIKANNPIESDLLVRLHLPKENEDHMPPKDKTQLSKEEIALLDFWVTHGSDFEKTAKELQLKKSLLSAFFPVHTTNDFPDIEVAEVTDNILQGIRNKGFYVEKISENTNYLRVTCINLPSFNDEDFIVLSDIKEQIAILDLGNTAITDASYAAVAGFPNVTVLKLDNNNISGTEIEILANCKHLKSINLVKTQFTDVNLEKLNLIPSLQTVYLYDSKVSTEAIKKLDPNKISVEYGNYKMPIIASDSILY